MENQNILVSNATETEKATFYKQTYKHLALAVLAFIVVETIMIKFIPVEVILWMLSGKFIWLFIIGLFWLGTTLSNEWTPKQSYRGIKRKIYF